MYTKLFNAFLKRLVQIRMGAIPRLSLFSILGVPVSFSPKLYKTKAFGRGKLQTKHWIAIK